MKFSRIVSCVCQHQFQDQRYGTGKRVANPTAKGTYRCTVCQREHGGKEVAK